MNRFFVLLSVIIIAVVACGCSFHISGGDNSANTLGSEPETTVSSTNEAEETTVAERTTAADTKLLESNIEVKTVVQKDGAYLAAFITNNNEATVDYLKLTVNFYDESNKIIDTDSDGHDIILSNSTVVSQFIVPENYDHCETEIEIETGIYSTYHNYAKELAVSHSKDNNGEIIEITNNSDVTIEEIEFVLIFYKDDDIIMVGSPYDIYDLKSGETATENYYFFGDYDKAEIYINQAHTF